MYSWTFQKSVGTITIGDVDCRDDRARLRLGYIPETPNTNDILTI